MILLFVFVIVEAGLGGSCSSASDITDSCSDTNAYCGQDICTCKTEYFDDNEDVLGGLCRLSKYFSLN